MPVDWGGSGGVIMGSAAPGVASLKVTLSDGKTVTVRPVSFGNERMFASWTSGNAVPTNWTAYDASGKQVDSGAVTPAAAASSK
jgi:hypothetical protein